ncbi:MAG: AAA family ATPase, partial [Nitrososphaera sp.]
MASKSRFLIDSLEVESFRAYNTHHSFSFKEPLTIFYGKNGNGKSSTLYAVE